VYALPNLVLREFVVTNCADPVAAAAAALELGEQPEVVVVDRRDCEEEDEAERRRCV